jgi:hypothetical protein
MGITYYVRGLKARQPLLHLQPSRKRDEVRAVALDLNSSEPCGHHFGESESRLQRVHFPCLFHMTYLCSICLPLFCPQIRNYQEHKLK